MQNPGGESARVIQCLPERQIGRSTRTIRPVQLPANLTQPVFQNSHDPPPGATGADTAYAGVALAAAARVLSFSGNYFTIRRRFPS